MFNFGFFAGLGAAVGIWQVVRHAPSEEYHRWGFTSWGVLLGILLGARAGYVLLFLPYYQAHPVEAYQIWMGGLDWSGAALGGLAAVLIIWLLLRRSMRIPLALLADRMAPLALPLAAALWLGCHVEGSLYGIAAPQGAWWGMTLTDETGLTSLRLPLQLIAAIVLAVCLLWLEIRPPHFTQAGQYASLVALSLSVVLLAASFLRADPSPRWQSLRPDSWAGIGFSLLALAGCWRSGLLGGVWNKKTDII